MTRPPRRQIGDTSMGAEVEARIAVIVAREQARKDEAAAEAATGASDAFGWSDAQGRHSRAAAQHTPAAQPEGERPDGRGGEQDAGLAHARRRD